MAQMYRSMDNQDKLKILNDKLVDKLEIVLDNFGITYEKTKKKIICACPVHGGDNKAACNIYHVGREVRGNWMCRTHQCEREFVKSAIGLVRGILSHDKFGWQGKGDKVVSFPETIKFVEGLLSEKLSSIKIDKVKQEKDVFIRQTEMARPIENKISIKRDVIRSSLQIPAEYYLNRGFSKEILDRYDIGLCTAQNKEMTDRVVIPVYDDDYQFMIGCTGRSVYAKCPLCAAYHNPILSCPIEKERWRHSKWKHNTDFAAQDNLFNYWFAIKEIQDTHSVVLVESPGNVLRLVAAGVKNVVASFGAHLTENQKFKLDCSGAMSITLIMDNDEAGRKAREEIRAMCSRSYRVFDVFVPEQYNDIDEMTDLTDVVKQIKAIK